MSTNDFYYYLEGVLNKSIIVWIKKQDLTLRDSILFLLKSYQLTEQEIKKYVDDIDKSINNWFLFNDNTGMRLVYSQTKDNIYQNNTSINDVYDVTVVEAKNKNLI